KCPLTGLNRRSDIRHGRGHACGRDIETNRRAFEATSPTHGAQIAGGARSGASAASTAWPEREKRSRARSESAGRRPTSNSARIHRPAWAAEEVRQKSCRFRARTRTGFVSVARAVADPPRRYWMARTPRNRLALGRFAPMPWAQHWLRRWRAKSRAARPSAPWSLRAGPAQTSDCDVVMRAGSASQASAPRRLLGGPPRLPAGLRFPCARARQGAGDRFGSSARAPRSPALSARPGRKEVAAAFRSGRRYKHRPRLRFLPPRPRQI